MSNHKEIWPIKTLIIYLLVLEVILLILSLFLFYVKPSFLDFLEWEFELYVWILAISPLLSVSFAVLWRWKMNALQRWKKNTITKESLSKDASFQDLSFKKSVVRFILFKLSIVCLIFSLLGPKSGGEMTETLSEGVELVLALDLSKSMLAEDVQPNRLYAAKSIIRNTIKSLQGDQVGLVVFSANAYVQMPLSNDYASALNYLETLNTSSVPVQGTSLSSAIYESLKMFKSESTASKNIILFTDGEDHEEEIEEALTLAKEKQVKISCIAVGSENGAPIPIYGGDEKYKKDLEGNTIVSKVNTSLLNGIAAEGDGFYDQINSSIPAEANQLKAYIKNQEKNETGSFQFVNLTPRFPIPLSIAILLFILSIAIKEKEGTWF